MRITAEHPASSYGYPVILGDDGSPMDYGPGMSAVRRALGLSTAELGAAVARSRRTVEDWEQGRYPPSAEVLYHLASLLKRVKKGRKKSGVSS